MALEESTFSVQTMKCKDSNERKDNTEHLTLNEILKMFVIYSHLINQDYILIDFQNLVELDLRPQALT
jgi:hypothetical protein